MLPSKDSFLTIEGHKCILQSSMDGFRLAVVPKEPPFEPEHLDIFYLGLRHSSALKVVDAIRNNSIYKTKDEKVVLTISEGRCLFTCQSNYIQGATFTCDFGESGTKVFAELLSNMLKGAPPSWVTEFEGDELYEKIGRNEKCPCGSGKKYKKCHLGVEFLFPEELKQFAEIDDRYVQMTIKRAHANPAHLQDPGFWNDMGTALGSGEEYAAAVACFNRALEFKREPEYLLNLAGTLNGMGELEQGLALVNEVPDSKPRKAIIKANLLQNLGRHHEAISDYENAIAEEPDFYLPYARILNSLKAVESPLYEYWIERAIRAAPTSPWIAVSYCRFLYKGLRIEELAGADWIDQLRSEAGRPDMVGRNQEDPRLLIEAQLFRAAALVAVSENQSDLEDAITILVSADQDWHFCDVAKLLTAIAANLGRSDLVNDAYPRICQGCRDQDLQIPTSLDAILARAYLSAGRFKEACKYCKKALGRLPGDQMVLWDYWWALDEIGEKEHAIEVAESLYALNSETEDLRYNLGYLCGKSGQFGRAKYYYEDQLSQLPEHRLALENVSFVYLLEGEVSKAEEVWRRFSEVIRSRFVDHYFVVDDLDGSDRGEERTIAASEFLKWKESKFLQLVEFAKDTIGSPSYSLDLVKLNDASSPLIGSKTAVGMGKFALKDLIENASFHSPQGIEEVRYKLKASQQGDYSEVINRLRVELPQFDELPESAQMSLIEGENRLNGMEAADYSPIVMSFSKAFEISLKELVFDRFREVFVKHHDRDQHLSMAKRDKKYDRIKRFIKFLSIGQNLELGSMAFTLQLATGTTAKRVFALRSFAEFIQQKQFSLFLAPETLKQIEKLSKDFRNPAVHSHVQNLKSAKSARALAVSLLSLFAS